MSKVDKSMVIKEIDALWLKLEQALVDLDIKYWVPAKDHQTGAVLIFKAKSSNEEPRFYVEENEEYIHVLESDHRFYLWKLIPEIWEAMKTEKDRRYDQLVGSVIQMRQILETIKGK